MELSPTLPRTFAWLGYGGLLPFLILALARHFDPHHGQLWAQALLSYGSVILSFVGALHWGFAMAQPELSPRLRNACAIWSVIPALLAWVALLLAPAWASALLAAGFLAHYRQDLRLARHTRLPAWFLPLRLQLTSVACLCLAATGFAYAA